MICPYCNATELIRDHSVTIPDPETGGSSTYDYWTCFNPKCTHFQKVVNGTKEGKQGEIMTVEQAKAKEAEDREIAKYAKQKADLTEEKEAIQEKVK